MSTPQEAPNAPLAAPDDDLVLAVAGAIRDAYAADMGLREEDREVVGTPDEWRDEALAALRAYEEYAFPRRFIVGVEPSEEAVVEAMKRAPLVVIPEPAPTRSEETVA